MKTSVSSETGAVESSRKAKVKRRHPLYMTWKNMMRRCYDPREVTYHMYGAVGVRVCERWHNRFNFFSDMSPKPSERHTMDRINGKLNYSPENCRWATIEEQNSNKRTNRWLEFRGERKTIAQWARTLGLDASLIRGRLERGWSIERSLTQDPKLYWKRAAA